jgi:DNA-binding IclR family transcriptional regulator
MTIDIDEAERRQESQVLPKYLLRRLLQHLAVLEWATPEELAQTMAIPLKQVHRLARCLEERQLLETLNELDRFVYTITRKGQEVKSPILNLMDLA